MGSPIKYIFYYTIAQNARMEPTGWRVPTYIPRCVLTAKFLVSISKLVAPPLDKVVRHGGGCVCGGCRSSQRFVARHALTHASRTLQKGRLYFIIPQGSYALNSLALLYSLHYR